MIACPCALVIATPVALASALASAARRGILLKGGQFLEEVGRLRVLAFDKTGTLTLGEPDVVEVVAADGRPGRRPPPRDRRGARRSGGARPRPGDLAARPRPPDRGPGGRRYEAVPGLGASGRVGATQYHIGSHRYIDEAGLCPPDFHARFGRAEAEGASGPRSP